MALISCFSTLTFEGRMMKMAIMIMTLAIIKMMTMATMMMMMMTTTMMMMKNDAIQSASI
jgi:hypothetical protein